MNLNNYLTEAHLEEGLVLVTLLVADHVVVGEEAESEETMIFSKGFRSC